MHSKNKRRIHLNGDSEPLPHPDTRSALADPVLLQEMLAAKTDDFLRLAADFDNFKKRSRRDSAQQAAAEKEAFIRRVCC